MSLFFRPPFDAVFRHKVFVLYRNDKSLFLHGSMLVFHCETKFDYAFLGYNLDTCEARIYDFICIGFISREFLFSGVLYEDFYGYIMVHMLEMMN